MPRSPKRLPRSVTVEGVTYYFPTRILAIRQQMFEGARRVEALVKWRGYYRASWTPWTDVADTDAAKHFINRGNPRRIKYEIDRLGRTHVATYDSDSDASIVEEDG